MAVGRNSFQYARKCEITVFFLSTMKCIPIASVVKVFFINLFHKMEASCGVFLGSGPYNVRIALHDGQCSSPVVTIVIRCNSSK